MSEHEYLDKTKWERPEHYAGFNPEGDYLLYSKHRESQIVSESNFAVIEAKMAKAVNELPEAERDPAPCDVADYGAFGFSRGEQQTREGWVYTWTASHSMVGWVEYLMLRSDAPESLKKKADEILHGLDGYCIASDDDYSDRQSEAVEEYWNNASDAERSHWFEGTDHEFDPENRDERPEQVSDMLRDSEMFY